MKLEEDSLNSMFQNYSQASCDKVTHTSLNAYKNHNSSQFTEILYMLDFYS